MRLARRLLIVLFVLVGVIALPRSISPNASAPSGRHSTPTLADRYTPFDSLRTDPHDYIWPTDASVVMTSSFGEFRSTHFHAGIDISTNDRRGYKVFASRDGFISRISVSPYGYGKMLYIQHADQHATTYAHLQRFNETIDEFVKNLQRTHGRYSLDVRLNENQFPVLKGDVIAYTGNTGIGSPHLHFEVRDEGMHPINPLLFPDFAERVLDMTPPEFSRIALTPLDYSSSVQGQLHAWSAATKRLSASSYRFDGIIRVSGRIGASVKTADRSNHPWHRNGIYRLEFYVDSAPFFSSELSRFPENDSKQIALHYDWHLLQNRKGAMQKLYVDTGNRLPLYDRLPEQSGVIRGDTLAPGIHELTVVAYDIAGNKSELSGRILLNHPPVIEVKEVEGDMYVTSPDLPGISSVTIALSRGPGRGWNSRIFQSSDLIPTVFGLLLPAEWKPSDVLRVVAHNRFDGSSSPEYVFSNKPRGGMPSAHLQKEFIRDFVRISVRTPLTFTRRPSLTVASGSRLHHVTLRAIDLDEYTGAFPLSVTEGNTVRLTAEAEVNSTPVNVVDMFTIFPVLPDKGGTVTSEDGEFSIEFPPQAVFAPMYCRLTKTIDGYAIEPDDVLLDKGGFVRYRVPQRLQNQNVGLFSSPDRSQNLLAFLDPFQPGVLRGRVSRFLGEFVLLVDSDPPLISQVHARYSGQKLQLSFHLHDGRAGVDADGIRVRLGDELLIGEYDPYGRKVMYEGIHHLRRGTHTIHIEAADRMGNVATFRESFSVSTRKGR